MPQFISTPSQAVRAKNDLPLEELHANLVRARSCVFHAARWYQTVSSLYRQPNSPHRAHAERNLIEAEAQHIAAWKLYTSYRDLFDPEYIRWHCGIDPTQDFED